MTRRRLTLVISSLAFGGAERVLSFMANRWAEQGNQVTLITLDSSRRDTYPLHPDVTRLGLDVLKDSSNILQALRNNLGRVKKLRAAIRESRPDFVVSFTDQINVLTLIATLGLPVPVIVAERTQPRHHSIGPVWSLLRRRFYRRCSALVVQTEQVRNAMQPLVGSRPIYVIPNAVFSDQIETKETERESTPEKQKRIIAMGRLSPEKGFALLIRVFASLAHRHPEWSLHILGTGPQQSELEEKIQENKLESRVKLHGWVENPVRFLRESEIFVLSSRYEGFPNALLEAMACGLPAVSFDCESGPSEIIREGIDGLLIPPGDEGRLRQALEKLIEDDVLRQKLAARAPEVVGRFRPERYFENWERVFSELSAPPTPVSAGRRP